MTDRVHELYRRWLFELWHGDYRHLDDLIDERFVGHWPDTEVGGRNGLVGMIEQTRAMLHDLRFELIVGPFAEDDFVAARWTGRGRGDDGVMSFTGNDILRVRDGKIAEYWVATVSSQAAR